MGAHSLLSESLRVLMTENDKVFNFVPDMLQ